MLLSLAMVAFLYYPLYLILFWYKDVLGGLLNFFVLFNRYIASLLSVSLLLRTFFKPLKNEYREGLVLFSVISGMIVKSIFLTVSLGIILTILFIEFLVGILVASMPIILIIVLLGAGSPIWYAQ